MRIERVMKLVGNRYSIVAAGLDFCACCRWWPWASGSLGQIGSQLNNELFCTSGTVWLLYVYQKVWMYEYIDKHPPFDAIYKQQTWLIHLYSCTAQKCTVSHLHIQHGGYSIPSYFLFSLHIVRSPLPPSKFWHSISPLPHKILRQTLHQQKQACTPIISCVVCHCHTCVCTLISTHIFRITYTSHWSQTDLLVESFFIYLLVYKFVLL